MGPIGICGGSDDHGALDIATTWTEGPGATPREFLAGVQEGMATVHGEDGSSVKLAHAVGALLLNAYRASGRAVAPALEREISGLFHEPPDGPDRHARIIAASSALAKRLAAGARRGALDLDQLGSLGARFSALLLAGSLEAPFVAAVRHHAQTRLDVAGLEAAFFGSRSRVAEPRALVFTDTFADTNGVAGTMRRLAAAGAGGCR